MTQQKFARSQILSCAMPRQVSFTVSHPYSTPLGVVVGHWPAVPGYRASGGMSGAIYARSCKRITEKAPSTL